MKIYIASDHTGYELKGKLVTYLEELGLGYEAEDLGAHAYDKEDDYPDFVKELAHKVAKDKGSMGIVLGGSGQGEAMCANRVKGIRAAVFYGQMKPVREIDSKGNQSSDSFEIIKLARVHNDANVLSIGVRFTTFDEIKFAIELFLATNFSEDTRHIRRIEKF
jgi:ribose 5-phosphate isomerase B